MGPKHRNLKVMMIYRTDHLNNLKLFLRKHDKLYSVEVLILLSKSV